MKTVLNHFHYVFQSWLPELNGSPAWHIEVTTQAESPAEKEQLGTWEKTGTLNMAQAEGIGQTLGALGEAINADALFALKSKDDEIAKLTAEIESLQEQLTAKSAAKAGVNH